MTHARPAFTIRCAVPEDALVLAALRNAMFEELGQHSPAEQQREFESLATVSFADGMQRGECCAWLAESEAGEAVGSTALLLFPRLPSPNSFARREGYLLSVYTLPAWRRRGVAAALVAAAIAKARELGLGRIRLHATVQGGPVYAAAGFQPRQDEMELRLFGMTSSPVELRPLARSVAVSDEVLTVGLADGRVISVPLVWFPRLLRASPEARSKWELLGDGEGIHWPEAEEDLSVEGLLSGNRVDGAA